jgi:hypothetical protein
MAGLSRQGNRMEILDGVNLPVHPTTGLRALGMGRRGPIWPVMGGSQPTGEGQQQSGGGQQQAGGQGGQHNGQQSGQQAGGQQGGGGQQQSGAGTSGTGAAGSPTSQGQQQGQQQGSGQHGSASQGGQHNGQQQGSDRDLGFPPDTPVAEMTDKQAAAYWRHQSRKHEERAKASAAQVADLKPRADQYDQLAQASRTEHEKALDEAKAQARAEAQREAALGLVRARMEFEAKGRLADDKLGAVLDPIDMTKFLAADGSVDTDKVKAFVDGIAPAQQGQGTQRPDMGQGRREAGPASGVQSGRDLYRQRHPAKGTATART